MFNRILVAIDQYENSRNAFEAALFLAKVANARLMLLQVLSFVKDSVSRQAPSLEVLRSLHDAAAVEGVNADLAQPFGDPSQTICDLARKWGADLLIVGQQNLVGLNKPIPGSVSNYVANHAPCPVLIVQNQAYIGSGAIRESLIAAAC